MNVSSRMVPQIGYCEALHRLCRVLLSAHGPQSAADRRNDAWQERSINSVCRHGAVHRSGIRRRSVVHRVVVRVETKGNVVRNPEDSVAPANNGLWVKTVGKADARRHVCLIEGNVGPTAWLHKEHVASQPWQAGYVGQASGSSRIRQPALSSCVEIGLTVEPLRPRSLQVVANAQIQGQLVREVVGVIGVEPPIKLLSSHQGGNHGLTEEVVLYAARVVCISKQEVREAETCEASEPRAAKSEGTARDVGLCVVIASQLQLSAKLECVTAADQRNAGREVELRVAVLNEALPLRARDIVRKVQDARSGRRPGDNRNRGVVLRGPANCG